MVEDVFDFDQTITPLDRKIRMNMAGLTWIREHPCQCNPPGSGQEFCTGHCVLRAEIDELKDTILQLQLERSFIAGFVETKLKDRRVFGPFPGSFAMLSSTQITDLVEQIQNGRYED